MKYFCLVTISFCVAISLKAQTPDTSVDARAEFIAGATYNSALNYYGRTDTLESKGLYPFMKISFKSGLYFNTSFIFINNKISTEYAATIAEAGYQFKNNMGDWSGNLFANTFFYRNNSSLVQSVVKGTAGINVSNINKIANVNFGGNVKLSDDLDYGASIGLDHPLRIENIGKGVIVLDPSAYVYAGTQNFTKTYYQRKNILFLPVGEEQVSISSKKFNVLSYEFLTPVIYALGKMNLILTPSYVLPQNLIVVDGRPDLSEKGKGLFYGTATVMVTL